MSDILNTQAAEIGAWLHAFATLLMCGLVWFVQVVHYPLFARVGPEAFAAYEAIHQSRTTMIVAPLMLTEAAVAVLLLVARPAGLPTGLLIANAILLAAVWGLTFFGAVPLHARLGAGFDAEAHRRLVAINWPRTLAWTAKSVVALLIARAAAQNTIA